MRDLIDVIELHDLRTDALLRIWEVMGSYGDCEGLRGALCPSGQMLQYLSLSSKDLFHIPDSSLTATVQFCCTQFM
jgi:hypothetical protein